MALQCDFGVRPGTMWTILGSLIGAMAVGVAGACVCCGQSCGCQAGGRFGRRGISTKGSLEVELELLRRRRESDGALLGDIGGGGYEDYLEDFEAEVDGDGDGDDDGDGRGDGMDGVDVDRTDRVGVAGSDSGSDRIRMALGRWRGPLQGDGEEDEEMEKKAGNEVGNEDEERPGWHVGSPTNAGLGNRSTGEQPGEQRTRRSPEEVGMG